MKHIKNIRLIIITITILLIYLILNAIAYIYSPFADWYTYNIFYHTTNVFSKITSPIPFSLGNILAYFYIYILPICLIITILVLIFVKKTRKILSNILIKVICFNLIVICGLFIFNDMIIYHSSNLSKLYFSTYDKEYTVDDLYEVGVDIVNRIGEIIPKINIDDNKNIVLPNDLEKLSIDALKNISNEYTLLKGYYPNAKTIHHYPFSGYGMSSPAGVYFPYTLEATYNDDYNASLPTTITHEYAHLKGFRKEDEATFISIIAGINSNDNLLKYSAYQEAYNYISNSLLNLDRDKYYMLDELFKSATNSYMLTDDFLKYSELATNRYSTISLASYDIYKNYSALETFSSELKELVSNNDSIVIKYAVNINGKSTIYDNVDITSLFNENSNAHLYIHLLIDFKTISRNDYDNIYNLIHINIKNILDIVSTGMNEKYCDNFQDYVKRFEKLLNGSTNSDVDDIIDEEKKEYYYSFYMLPNTKDNFFEPSGNDYNRAVRLLLEYYDNK